MACHSTSHRPWLNGQIRITLEVLSSVFSLSTGASFAAEMTGGVNMKFNATILYKGALASYEIYREVPGVFSAELKYYDGDASQRPPVQISLVQGIRQWAGSIEDKKVLNTLGTVIEKNLGELSPFSAIEK